MVATLKRKSKTVHKDQTKTQPPPRVVTPQDNGPSDDVILVFAGQLLEVRADMVALRKVEKKIKQRMINAGISVGEMNEAIKLTELGPDAVADRFKKLLRYSKALGAPIGTQLSFFTEPGAKTESFEDQLKKAFDWGRTLSLLGKGPDEQMYPPNTPLGQEHLKGWQDGQQVRYAELTRNSEEEAARVQKIADDKAAKAKKKADSPAGQAEATIRKTMDKLDDPAPATDAPAPETEATPDDAEV